MKLRYFQQNRRIVRNRRVDFVAVDPKTKFLQERGTRQNIGKR